MANPLNMGSLTGRVSQDIKEFPHADGSKTLLVTLAVENNFLSGSGSDRKAKTQYPTVRVFLPKSINGRGPWDNVGNGDLIAVATRISCEPYQKNGETVYPAISIEADGFPQFMEPKTVTQERAARKAAAALATAGNAAPVADAQAAPAGETADETIARLEKQLAEKGELQYAGHGAPQNDYENTSPFPSN